METKLEVSCMCRKLAILDPVLIRIEGESVPGQVVGISREAVQVAYRNKQGQYQKIWIGKHEMTRYKPHLTDL